MMRALAGFFCSWREEHRLPHSIYSTISRISRSPGNRRNVATGCSKIGSTMFVCPIDVARAYNLNYSQQSMKSDSERWFARFSMRIFDNFVRMEIHFINRILPKFWNNNQLITCVTRIALPILTLVYTVLDNCLEKELYSSGNPSKKLRSIFLVGIFNPGVESSTRKINVDTKTDR